MAYRFTLHPFLAAFVVLSLVSVNAHPRQQGDNPPVEAGPLGQTIEVHGTLASNVFLRLPAANGPSDENLAVRPSAAAIASVAQPIGGGSKDPNIIRDGALAGSTATAYDTYNGQNQTSAWFGIVFGEALRFNALDFQLGSLWHDGGWFITGTTRIELFDGSAWQPVANPTWQNGAPEASETAPFGAPLTSFSLFSARFSPVTGRGIRIIGQPARGDSFSAFAGCGEIRLFYRPGGSISGPRIELLSPNHGVQGTGLNLRVVGKLLNGASAITFDPAAGIRSTGSIIVTPDGMQLDVPVTIDPDAPVGTRSVTIQTAAGPTLSAATGSNQFTIQSAAANQLSDENLALRATGTPTVSVTAPTGGGSKDPAIIKNDVLATVADTATQFDTYNGENQTTAWFGIVFSESLKFNALQFQLGKLFHDGGWFISNTVSLELFNGTVWQPIDGVAWATGAPEAADTAAFGAPLQEVSLKSATFPTVLGRGIRIKGQPAHGDGANAFVGCGELRLFYRLPPAGTGQSVWTMYRADLTHTGLNPYETAISRTTVSRLAPKWAVQLSATSPATLTGVFATPVVSDGVAYVGSMDGYFHAIRLSDGQPVWPKIFLGHRDSAPLGGNGVVGSAALQNGVLYIGSDDATVWAIRASDGTVVWKAPLAPLDGTAESKASSGQSSPMVVGNQLFIGISNGTGDQPCSIGRVVSLRVDTGAVLWDTAVTQAPLYGAGVWSTVAVDVTKNQIYVSTGNSCFPSDPPNPVNLDNSLLGLDMTTGAVKWLYRHLVGDTEDLDFGSSPVMFNGKIAAISKSGYLVAVPQTSAQYTQTLAWQTQIAQGNSSPYGGGGVNSPSFAYDKIFVGGGPVFNPVDNPTSIYAASFAAVDPVDGHVIWRLPIAAVPFGASAVVNGVVFTADRYDLLALNTDNGTVLKRLTGTSLMWGGITVAAGVVLVGDQNGFLHCYSIDGF